MIKENKKIQTLVDNDSLRDSLNYTEYRTIINELLERNLVTGFDQKSSYLDYTRMNIQRMNRWDKHFEPNLHSKNVIGNISEPRYWFVLTEGWCGDSAQVLPALEKLSSLNPLIKTKYLMRDEHEELMQQFLTNGAKSIPMVICVDSNLRVLWKWGPRPLGALDALESAKKEGLEIAKGKERLHLWYAKNKQEDLQQELTELISQEV